MRDITVRKQLMAQLEALSKPISSPVSSTAAFHAGVSNSSGCGVRAQSPS
jgi:hypothetical protein